MSQFSKFDRREQIQETQWTLRIGCEPGRDIQQGEIGTSEGPLTTGGLTTCVAVGIASEDKVLMAHVDAGCHSGVLAYWIDQTFPPETPVTVHLWNHLGADTPLCGHAARVVDRALSYSKLDTSNVINHGRCTPFNVVKIGKEGT